ncbi:MAG: ABC transporter six-transmembrane domain-containing protein [Planctomycetota bacterium]
MNANVTTVSLKSIFAKYRLRILGTWSLVVIEAALMLLFPLLMGIAIDDLFQQSYRGLYLLAATGFATNLVGSLRRFYDTRLYSRIYASVAEQIVQQENQKDSGVSITSARVNMVSELVEFMENSFPAIIDATIALTGTLVMVSILQFNVFLGCLIATAVIAVLYGLTSRRTYRLNKGFNDESEMRVKVLATKDRQAVAGHFSRIVRWNIRLSDLETMNYALSWVVMIGVLLFAILVTVRSGVSTHGQVLAILMYVFGYIESVISIPLFYQQYVRLQEITHRIDDAGRSETTSTSELS